MELIAPLVSLLIAVLVIGFLVWLVLLIIAEIPLPPGWQRIARIIVYAIAVLVLIGYALPLLHIPMIR